MKTTLLESDRKVNLSDPYWRFVHGFDNIDSKPEGWPIIR